MFSRLMLTCTQVGIKLHLSPVWHNYQILQFCTSSSHIPDLRVLCLVRRESYTSSIRFLAAAHQAFCKRAFYFLTSLGCSSCLLSPHTWLVGYCRPFLPFWGILASQIFCFVVVPALPHSGPLSMVLDFLLICMTTSYI